MFTNRLVKPLPQAFHRPVLSSSLAGRTTELAFTITVPDIFIPACSASSAKILEILMEAILICFRTSGIIPRNIRIRLAKYPPSIAQILAVDVMTHTQNANNTAALTTGVSVSAWATILGHST
jgi:hypothetical protein